MASAIPSPCDALPNKNASYRCSLFVSNYTKFSAISIFISCTSLQNKGTCAKQFTKPNLSF